MVFGPHFEHRMRKAKGSEVKLFVKATFLLSDHTVFFFCFVYSSFVSFLLLCLLVYFLHNQPPCPCELVIKVLQCA